MQEAIALVQQAGKMADGSSRAGSHRRLSRWTGKGISSMESETHSRPRMTWVEVAIVGVVLAVLAALVVPPLSEAGTDPRIQELRSAVQVVRGQIEIYRLQHENRCPSLKEFSEQMTRLTNSRGQVAPASSAAQTADVVGKDYTFGPYLRCIPVNPCVGTNTISARPDGSSAWVYDEQTGEFRPNRTDVHLER
jgi:general secretion pathway protein G